MSFLGGESFMLGNLIGGFIVILIGVNLLPIVADQVVHAQSGNLSQAANPAVYTITGLITLFFALGVMSAGVALSVSSLRNAGLI